MGNNISAGLKDLEFIVPTIPHIKQFFTMAVAIITLDQITRKQAGIIFDYLKLLVLYIGGIGLFCSLLLCMPLLNIFNGFPFILVMIIAVSKIKDTIKKKTSDTKSNIIPDRVSAIVDPIFYYVPLHNINYILGIPYTIVDKVPGLGSIISEITKVINIIVTKAENIPILEYVIKYIVQVFSIIKELLFVRPTLKTEDIILYILIILVGII